MCPKWLFLNVHERVCFSVTEKGDFSDEESFKSDEIGNREKKEGNQFRIKNW